MTTLDNLSIAFIVAVVAVYNSVYNQNNITGSWSSLKEFLNKNEESYSNPNVNGNIIVLTTTQIDNISVKFSDINSPEIFTIIVNSDTYSLNSDTPNTSWIFSNDSKTVTTQLNISLTTNFNPKFVIGPTILNSINHKVTYLPYGNSGDMITVIQTLSNASYWCK